MNSEALYLRRDIQVEPLIDNWYAWSHLIPPATAARNLTDRHLKIMDSYIGAPQLHAQAVRNPKLRGGPFMHYQGKRSDEVRALRERTGHDRANLIRLSSALAELSDLVRNNAEGYSLEPLYNQIPEPLKGYAEIFYHLNNRPSFRVIEPLLYRSQPLLSAIQSKPRFLSDQWR